MRDIAVYGEPLPLSRPNPLITNEAEERLLFVYYAACHVMSGAYSIPL